MIGFVVYLLADCCMICCICYTWTLFWVWFGWVLFGDCCLVLLYVVVYVASCLFGVGCLITCLVWLRCAAVLLWQCWEVVYLTSVRVWCFVLVVRIVALVGVVGLTLASELFGLRLFGGFN